jgi:aspartokinase/homoserine dehydrogenase 1
LRSFGAVSNAAARPGLRLALPSPQALDRLSKLTSPMIIDCTSSSSNFALYLAATRRGIHLISRNARPFVVSWAEYELLLSAARRHRVSISLEGTVGANLPLLYTLKMLRDTGDTVTRIYGSFSGTIGFVLNRVMDGVSLRAALAEATAKVAR